MAEDEEIIVGTPETTETADASNEDELGYGGRSPVEGIFASEEHEMNVVNYLDSEIQECDEDADRAEFVTQWQTWRRHRMARPAEKIKNFPWPNAANICTPMTMSNTNAMYAKILGMLNKRKPRIKCVTESKQWREHAPVIAKVLNKLNDSPFLINMPLKDQKVVYETVSMGTHPVEVPWKTISWSLADADATGEPDGTNNRRIKKVYDGPMPESVPLERFLMWHHFENPDDAPWVAFKYRYTYAQLKQLASVGFFDQERVDSLLLKPTTEESDSEKALNDVIGLSTNFGEDLSAVFELYKVYVYADVDGSGQMHDVIGWFSSESRSFLRLEFNMLPIRPISILKYLPIPGLLFGMGIGWMSEPTQEEIDSIHNIRINSMVLASLQMLAKKKGSQMGHKEAMFPGKIMEFDDPQKDWSQVRFPDVSPSTVQAETMARQYLDRSIGASEPMFGMADSIMKSGDTATGAMFRAQTGTGLIEVIFESFLDGYRKIYLLELMQLVVNDVPARDMISALADTDEEKILINQVLDLSVDEIPTLFAFDIEVTPTTQTEEAKRQGILMLTQLYSQLEQGLLQGYAILSDPQAPQQIKEVETKIILGKVTLMEETLKMFGVRDTNDYLPYVEDLRTLSEMMARMADIKNNTVKQQMESLPPVGSGVTDGQGSMGGTLATPGAIDAGPQGTAPGGGIVGMDDTAQSMEPATGPAPQGSGSDPILG